MVCRNALVTGGSSGIGREVVRLLSQDPHRRVAVVSRRSVESWESPPTDQEQSPVVIPIDLSTHPSSYADVLQHWLCEHPTLDTLVLSAVTYGANRQHSFLDTTFSEADALFLINVIAALHIARLCIPTLCNNNGQIIAISSLSAARPEPGKAAYAASKAAFHSIFSSIQEEYRDNPALRVILVSPKDVVSTPGVRRRRDDNADLSQYLTPLDIATGILALITSQPSSARHVIIGKDGYSLSSTPNGLS